MPIVARSQHIAPPSPAGRLTGDVLQAALGTERASESINNALKSALLGLVDALAWADNNPNRAEYIATLGALHREDPCPELAAIVTAAGWLHDSLTGDGS